jgi:hypothetical protein
MSTLTERVTTAVELLEADAQIQHDVSNGLANETVTTEGGQVRTVANAIATLMATVPRGAWLTTTVYAIRDLVTQSNVVYICVVAHTAGVFATDLAAGKWAVFSGPADEGSVASGFARQRRRDTRANLLAFTGLAGELTWDTTLKAVRGHDGATAGGILMARERVFDVRSYGAVGDGATDDTTAITAALTAALAVGGTLHFGGPENVYVVDGAFVITAAMTVTADGATLKLKNSSALWTNTAGTYGRYLMHVRASNVTIRGLRFDGNSPNNSATIGGNLRYRYSSGATVHSVGCIVVGWVPLVTTPIASSNIENVTIRDCTFVDSSDTGISLFNQDGLSQIRHCQSINCVFIRGQNVQNDLNNCFNYQAIGNRHVNAYFCSFQFYYSNTACQFLGCSVYHKDSEIDVGLVDWGLLSGGALIFHGYLKLGKDATAPNLNCAVKDCQLYGTGIYMNAGMAYSLIDGCTIDSAEKLPGIEYAGDVGVKGNVVSNNLIRNCDFPGIYHGGDGGATDTILYEGNRLFGNNQSAAQYGGRDQFANIFLIAKGGIFRNNFARKVGTKPTYGVAQFAAVNIAGCVFARNDFVGSGNTSDLSLVNPPIGAMVGDLQIWEWNLPATASQAGAFDVVPTGDGILFVSAGVVCGMFAIKSDGTVTLPAQTAGGDAVLSTYLSTTDVANKLCVVDNGTNVYIRNNLAAGAQEIRAMFIYR